MAATHLQGDTITILHGRRFVPSSKLFQLTCNLLKEVQRILQLNTDKVF